MIALVLALFLSLGVVAPAHAAPPPPPSPATSAPTSVPTSIEDGCDPGKLAPMLSAQWRAIPPPLAEIDRRTQYTLAEERRQEALSAEQGKQSEAAQKLAERVRLGVVALAVLSLLAGIQSVRRQSRLGAVAAWAILLLAGALHYHSAAQKRALDEERQSGTQRSLTLTACRLRLQETRGLLEHAELAHYIDALGEADEDIMSWQAKMHGGLPLSEAEVTRLHNEIVSEMR